MVAEPACDRSGMAAWVAVCSAVMGDATIVAQEKAASTWVIVEIVVTAAETGRTIMETAKWSKAPSR